MLERYDSLNLSLERLGNMRLMSVEEVIGSLKMHERRFQERDSREEAQALLSRAFNQDMKNDSSQSSRRRG